MSVYVDDGRWRLGRMKMAHLLADSSAELHAMAQRLGVERKWCEEPGTWREHYNVCLATRRRAIAAGAIPITQREAARRRAQRRTGGAR